MNIAQYIENGCRQYPDKPALIFEGKSFTYGELNEMVNRVANGLCDLEVECGDRVALFLPNIPAFAIAYLSILKIGAIAVSLNSSLKREEVRFILEDSDPKVLVTTEELRENVPAYALSHLKHIVIAEGDVVDDFSWNEWTESSSSGFHCMDMNRDDPAAILYTSGTTGFPKGATLSHGNVISNMKSFVNKCGMTPDDRILLFLPLFHCFGQNAILNSTLSAGMTIILQRQFITEQVIQLVIDAKITLFFGVPNNFITLYEKASVQELSSVHYYFSAAASLPVEIARKWKEKYGTVINEAYGLTETTPFASYNHQPDVTPGSIGLPIEDVEMKIVNFDDREVKPGDMGEIIIKGPNVMLGYWNRPSETTRVIKDGWFHSGDIGKRDEDGYFYIVYRLKDMINVGGLKVYPVEVENILYQHPAVSEAAVFGVPEDFMGEQVNAQIVLKRDRHATSEEIISHCRKLIADFKVPTVVEFVENIPKNPAGKVLKRVLREEKSSITATQEEVRLPVARTADSIRDWLVEWMGKELEIDKAAIKPDKSFFDYGLTSVLAVKLSQELGSWLGHSLNATTTWNFSTIESLADYLVNLFKTPSSFSKIKQEVSTQIHPVEYKTTDALPDTQGLSDSEMAKLLNEEIRKSREGRQK
ncbi:MAG: AMP-binding protein [Colwellia sp.]|nr:AMP-binding protein [Colwellia sp.]